MRVKFAVRVFGVFVLYFSAMTKFTHSSHRFSGSSYIISLWLDEMKGRIMILMSWNNDCELKGVKVTTV